MTTKGGVGVHNVVPNLYDGIIKEVISSVKDDFINEGLDESVLEELKKLWNKKLKDSRALEGPPEPDKKRVMYVYMPSNKEGGQSNQVTGQKVVQYRPVQAGNRPVAQVISGTRVVQQHPVYSQQRSQVIRQTVTNDPNQPGTGQRTLLIRRVTDSRPQTNQRNIQRVVQLPVHNQQGGVIKQPVIKQNIQNIRQGQLPGQLDGKLAGSDSSDLDSSDDSESEREEPQPDNEDEPLGSDDDLKDETDAGVFDTDNIVVCQFDKIQRVRNKWRFYLKDGIMHLNGKDYVFQKATGDGEW